MTDTTSTPLPTIILLHGLLRKAKCMEKLRKCERYPRGWTTSPPPPPAPRSSWRQGIETLPGQRVPCAITSQSAAQQCLIPPERACSPSRRIERDTGWTAYSLQYHSREKTVEVAPLSPRTASLHTI